jgi:hypothetical protein
LMVWLLPLVGAAIVCLFLQSSESSLPKSDQNFEPQGKSMPGLKNIRW